MIKPIILTIAILLSGCEYMQVKDSSHATTMLERSLESCHGKDFKLSCGGVL